MSIPLAFAQGDDPIAKKRKVEEMAFGGTDPNSPDGLFQQAFFGRFAANFRPKRMCTFFQEGNCTKGDSCTFAHSLEELHPDAQAQASMYAEHPGFEGCMPSPVKPGLKESAPQPQAGEEVSFLSLATGPRDFTGHPPPKALCRFFLHHPTYCLQGDSCPHAHGLSELGLDDKSCSIKSSVGSTASVTVEEGVWLSAWGGKGSPGKAWWGPTKGQVGEKGWAPASCKGFDKGKGWMKGKGGPGQMALPGLSAGLGENRFAAGGFMPTKICQFWLQDPSACRRGAECSFAHGVQELQPGYAEMSGVSRFHHMGSLPTKMCTFFLNNACTKGYACTFAHCESELVGANAIA